MKTTTKVNSKELFAHCFNIMKKLDVKVISVEEAKAHANLVKQANNLLKYELDRAKAIAKYDNMEVRDIEEG